MRYQRFETEIDYTQRKVNRNHKVSGIMFFIAAILFCGVLAIGIWIICKVAGV